MSKIILTHKNRIQPYNKRTQSIQKLGPAWMAKKRLKQKAISSDLNISPLFCETISLSLIDKCFCVFLNPNLILQQLIKKVIHPKESAVRENVFKQWKDCIMAICTRTRESASKDRSVKRPYSPTRCQESSQPLGSYSLGKH